MTYIIAEPCVDVLDRACVDVCPVDCIYENKADALSNPIDKDGNATDGTAPEEDLMKILLIHPEECIDCGACEPECPVEAIFAEGEVPEQWNKYIPYNYEAFGVAAP